MQKFGTHLPTLLSEDRLCNLIKYSNYCLRLEGYMAEFGVYAGGSLEALAFHNPGRDMFGIDSFQGLPKESVHDFHHEGDFSQVDYAGICGYFKMIYPHVRIVKGFSPDVWKYFNDTVRFSFVHVDVDLYQSVLDALDFFLPRTVSGGILLFDDYKVNTTPGCERAIADFFANDIHEVAHREELKYWNCKEAEAPTHHQYLIVAK